MSQFTSKLSIYISCPKINSYSISNGEEILKFNFQCSFSAKEVIYFDFASN